MRSKKIISSLLAIIFIAQIGCGPKVERVSSPIQDVKFGNETKYSVSLKKGEKIETYGSKLKVEQKHVVVESGADKKKISDQEIDNIAWTRHDGTYALRGMLIGALVAGIPMTIAFTAAADGFSDWSESEGGEGATTGQKIAVGLLGGALSAIGGGVIGLGIGALFPKHTRVLLTPVVTQTQDGVSAGGQVGVKF